MNNIPDDVLYVIINFLDVKSSINFVNSCSKLKIFNNDDIENKKNMSSIMTTIYNHGIGTVNALMKATTYGYLDMIKILLPEIDVMDTNIHNLDYIFTLSCKYNHKDIIHYYFDYYKNNFDLYPFSRFYYDCSKYIINSNDDLLFDKFIMRDISRLCDIIASAAEEGIYEKFHKYYNICRNICFCGDNVVVYDNNKFKEFRTNNCKIVNDKIQKYNINKSFDNYSCECGIGTKKYIMPEYTHIIYSAALGKSYKIINYLLEGGESNYNDGLIGAITINDKAMIDFFIKLGAKKWKNALKVSVTYCHVDLIDFFYKKINDLTVFDTPVYGDKYNPINFYVHHGLNDEDYEDYEDRDYTLFYILNSYLERTIELNWTWILESIIDIMQNKFSHIIYIDYNIIMNSGAKHGHEDMVNFCLGKNSDINKLELFSSCKGKNINIIKMVKVYNYIEYSFILALKSEKEEIIDYVYNILNNQYEGDVDWIFLLQSITLLNIDKWFEWIYNKCVKRGFDPKHLYQIIKK